MQEQPDPVFERVGDVERNARRVHAERMQHYRSAIAIADSLLQLEGSGAYQALHKALKDMLEYRTNELFLTKNEHDSAVAKGRCLELRAILSLVISTRSNRDILAQQMRIEEDRFLEQSKNFKPETEVST